MGIRNPNSTDYVHPDEPNLLNVHKAMVYNSEGEPCLRAKIEGVEITGDVVVDKVKLWDGTNDLLFDLPNNDGETAPQSLPTESHNMVFNGSTWDRMRGNSTTGILVNGAIEVTNMQDNNYYMEVARSRVTDHSVFFRSGFNPSTSQDVLTSVWVEGGIYPHGTWTTAQQLHVASDNAADTGQTIFIEGLDSSYNYQTDTVTTNGTVGVLSTKSFIRIYTATVTNASTDSANAGEIRFRLGSISGTVVAHIRTGLGITKLSQYTVPAGYTAYIVYGDATSFRGGSGNIGTELRMMVRPFGGAFVCAFISEVVNGYYRNDFTIPLKITEKSDIDVRVIADGNNTKVSCNYQMIVIKN